MFCETIKKICAINGKLWSDILLILFLAKIQRPVNRKYLKDRYNAAYLKRNFAFKKLNEQKPATTLIIFMLILWCCIAFIMWNVKWADLFEDKFANLVVVFPCTCVTRKSRQLAIETLVHSSLFGRFEMMSECWSYDVANRPAFSTIYERLNTFTDDQMSEEVLRQFEFINKRLESEVCYCFVNYINNACAPFGSCNFFFERHVKLSFVIFNFQYEWWMSI